MREVIRYMVSHHGYSQRRACRVTRTCRRRIEYKPHKKPHTELRMRMKEIATARPRFGYRRILVMLKREGWNIGKKLVYRLYGEESLLLRNRGRKRRKMMVERGPRCQPKRVNEVWSLDFVADQLSNGQKIRALTVVDIFSREALAIEVGQRLRGEDVVNVLNRLVMRRGAPKYLFADNGAEFTGRIMDMWAYHHHVRIDFSRPGKPTDNAFIETFNGSLRAECLNLHWFTSLQEAKEIIEAWRRDYNESRPHSSLGNMPPLEYTRQHRDFMDSSSSQPPEN
jgi:putative transposase